MTVERRRCRLCDFPTNRNERRAAMPRIGRPGGSSLCIGLALSLVPAPGAAQAGSAPPAPANLVRVGDGTMSGARIQPYDNIWLVTVRRTDGSVDERGLSSDHVRFRNIGGRRYLTRVEGTTEIVGAAG